MSSSDWLSYFYQFSPQGLQYPCQFGGRLSLDPFGRDGVEDLAGTSIFLAPTNAGSSAPLLDENGVIQSIPFVYAEPDASIKFDLSGVAAGSAHDFYLLYNFGFVVLLRVPWINEKPQSEAAYLLGREVNKTQITGFRSEGPPALIPQYRGLYIGSARVGDDGILKCDVSYGQNRRWDVWNAYNQKQIYLRGGDTEYHWGAPGSSNDHAGPNYTQCFPDWTPIFNDPKNCVSGFCGRPSFIDLEYHGAAWKQTYAGSSAIAQIAIGWNSLTLPSGQCAQWDTEGFTGIGYIASGYAQRASLQVPGACGTFIATVLAKTQGVIQGHSVNDGTSAIMIGAQEVDMLLSAKWFG